MNWSTLIISGDRGACKREARGKMARTHDIYRTCARTHTPDIEAVDKLYWGQGDKMEVIQAYHLIEMEKMKKQDGTGRQSVGKLLRDWGDKNSKMSSRHIGYKQRQRQETEGRSDTDADNTCCSSRGVAKLTFNWHSPEIYNRPVSEVVWG